jgi:hypothetical protein
MNAETRFLLLSIVLLFLPSFALAANGVLYIAPQYATEALGETFDVRVLVDTDGATINAAEAELAFDPKALAVTAISTDGSILGSFATPPEFSNVAGTIRFTGWTRNEYAGKDGLLVTIAFKALRKMTSNAQLTAGTILAVGANGSNIVTSMKSATYAVSEERSNASEASTSAAASVRTAQAPQPLPTAPSFSEDEQTIQPGEHVIVRGTASPDAKVLIALQRGDGTPKTSAVYAGADGSFTYLSDDPLQEGTYTLLAQVEDQSGQRSPPSQKLTVHVFASGILTAQAATGAATSGFPFAIILFCAALAGGYVLHRLAKKHA